ncbi:unnamed protein product [Clavelina lepadiformis]|uniref:Uncharacterized protein n=1 Tax=Clavelina lepadiformis TaxID=159417 RepID=A0ABP0GC06_CLALP
MDSTGRSKLKLSVVACLYVIIVLYSSVEQVSCGAERILTQVRPRIVENHSRSKHDENPVQKSVQRCPRRCLCYFNVAYCASKQLTILPAKFPPGIKYLHLSKNKLKIIPRDKLGMYPSLNTIDLSDNFISQDGVKRRSFANLALLKRLHLNGNKFTHFPSSLPPSVVELKLDNNSISVIQSESTQPLGNVTSMDLSRNKLTNAGIRNSAFLAFRSLVNLDLSFNKFESFPKDLSSSIEDIRLNNNRIKYVTTGVFRFPAKIHHLNMRGNKLKETSFSYQSWANMDKLIFLDLSENNLLFVPGVLPRSLSILLLESNNIENILEWSFSSVPKITQIRLSFNNIRHIDPAAFASLQNLQYLDLAHNQLLHYPSNMPINLQAVFVEFNAISNVHGDAFCPAYAQTTFQRSKLNMIVLIGNPVNRRSLFSAASYCLSSAEVLVFD